MALRKALEEGEHVPRIKKSVMAVESEAEGEAEGEVEGQTVQISESQMVEYTNKLGRVIRWNSFLTHTSINAHELIDSVTNGTLDHDINDFRKLRTKVMENTRSYKNKVLGLVEVSNAFLPYPPYLLPLSLTSYSK